MSTRPQSAVSGESGEGDGSRPTSKDRSAKSKSGKRKESAPTNSEANIADYNKLKNKCHNLSMNQRAYQDESAHLIRKQQSTIDHIRAENEAIKRELALEARQARQVAVTNHKEQIERCHEEIQALSKRINEERAVHAALDADRQKILESIKTSRAQIGAEGGLAGVGNNNDTRISTSIKIFENRLEKALQKFNEALSVNKRLRLEIQEVRLEKERFDKQYSGLQKDLLQKKREMARVIEIANEAYEARDTATTEMTQIKQQNQKEEMAYLHEVDELNVILKRDRDMRERALQSAGTPESYDQEQQKKKAERAGSAAAAREKHTQEIASQVREYEENFRRICDATGVSDPDQLVPTFQDAEERNMKLFNFLTELNSEIEKLQDAISEEKAEVEQYRGTQNDQMRLRILEDLEQKVARSEARADRYETKFNDCLTVINSCRNEIKSIVDLICDPHISAEIAKDDGLTDANIMTYLGHCEQRTTEILQLRALSEAKKTESSVPFPFASPQTQAGFLVPSVQLPNSEDFVDDEDDEQEEVHPLSHEELRARILTRVDKTGSKDQDQAARQGRARRVQNFSLDRMHLPLPYSTRLKA